MVSLTTGPGRGAPEHAPVRAPQSVEAAPGRGATRGSYGASPTVTVTLTVRPSR